MIRPVEMGLAGPTLARGRVAAIARTALRVAVRWLHAGALFSTCLMLMIIIGVLVWARQVVPATGNARFALDSDDVVMVSKAEWITFRPRDVDPGVGVIFYPGGKAEPVAYAPVLKALAARGYLVVLCPMPLNLAPLAGDRAEKVIPRYPEIQRWVMAGHSLGGVIAAEFVEQHPDMIAGLLLWASYPAGFTNLATTQVPVFTLYGTADRLAAPDEVLVARSRLPAGAVYRSVAGGDHWGFADFATAVAQGVLVRPAQQARVLDETASFLQGIQPPDSGTMIE